mmetsp:Transcript_7493/g.14175  ORF Transcript_7493/g.14175 Transcript_7493/m.14175 type:complete len:996 (+) Transcript_7493:202-3189(+)
MQSTVEVAVSSPQHQPQVAVQPQHPSSQQQQNQNHYHQHQLHLHALSRMLAASASSPATRGSNESNHQMDPNLNLNLDSNMNGSHDTHCDLHGPIRVVATLSDFRRSVLSSGALLQTQQQRLQRQHIPGGWFALKRPNPNRRSSDCSNYTAGTTSSTSNESAANAIGASSSQTTFHQTMSPFSHPTVTYSSNPMLKLMEERMAKAAADESGVSANSIAITSTPAPFHTSTPSSTANGQEEAPAGEANGGETSAADTGALQASINKWAQMERKASSGSSSSCSSGSYSSTSSVETDSINMHANFNANSSFHMMPAQVLPHVAQQHTMETVFEKKTPSFSDSSAAASSSPNSPQLTQTQHHYQYVHTVEQRNKLLQLIGLKPEPSWELSQKPDDGGSGATTEIRVVNRRSSDIITSRNTTRKSSNIHSAYQHMQLQQKQQLFQNQYGVNVNSQGNGNIDSNGNFHQNNYLPTRRMYRTFSQPDLPSSYHSSPTHTEVDRLRRENQSIQLRQLLKQQYQQQQHQYGQMQMASEHLEYLRQRDYAASVLAQSQHEHPVPPNGGNGVSGRISQNNNVCIKNREEPQKQDQQKSFIPNCNSDQPTATSTRKRPSVKLNNTESLDYDYFDDDTANSSKSHNSSAAPSLASNVSLASNKIHRSTSATSVRSNNMKGMTGSLENLKLHNLATHVTAGNADTGLAFARTAGKDHNNQTFDFNYINPAQGCLLNNSGVSPLSFSKKHSADCVQNGRIAGEKQGMVFFSKKNSAGDVYAKQPSVRISKNGSLTTLDGMGTMKSTKSSLRTSTPQLNIASTVPDRIKYQNSKPSGKPIDIIKEALASRGLPSEVKPCLEIDENFFYKYPPESLTGYSQEAVNAIRANDVNALRKLSDGGTNLQCANRFGESLIHLACRRSNRDVIAYLITDGGVSLRVRDDYGRTPVHDACWRAEVDLELIDMLLDKEPKLWMLSDKRGHTPLDYARREHWDALIPFLRERAEKFCPV